MRLDKAYHSIMVGVKERTRHWMKPMRFTWVTAWEVGIFGEGGFGLKEQDASQVGHDVG